MPIIQLTFSFPLNVSVQVGDTTYYHGTGSIGSHLHNSSPPVEMGLITQIDDWNGVSSVIYVDFIPNPPGSAQPTSNHFIMFSKDNKANLSSVLGYYAEVEFRSDSKDEAELFSVSTGFFESSK